MITKTKVIKQELPIELLVCDELPKVPNIKMQSEAADYTIRLYKVADQCKSKIENIKKFVKSGGS